MDRMVAYCGVNCSVCPDLLSGKCPSCRLSIRKDGDICMPVKCCSEKGIENCGQCTCFPCEDMAAFYLESDSHREAYMRLTSARGAGADPAPERKDLN